MATDKSSILRAFNTLFFDFVDDIIRIFPENEDIKVSREFFTTVKRANPTSLLKAWNTYVYSPYSEVIDSGNIDFFFDKNYQDDLTVLANATEIMKAIDTIREPVRNMSAVNKEHSMQYIQKLSLLSTMYK
jgi:hypothetical protein